MIFDEENFPEIPASWSVITVQDACDNVSVTAKIPAKEYLAEGVLAVIDQGEKFIGGYANDIGLAVSSQLPVVVFGDHTRAIKFVEFPFAAGADGIKVLRPFAGFEPKLFYRLLQSVRLPNKGYARHFQHLRSSQIPLPPLPEQKRIADKLDSVLARVDACRDRLDRIPTLLKRFRQSVLADGMSGRLTNDWRSPEGLSTWQQCEALGNVGTVSGGLTKNGKRAEMPLQRPYLRVANVQTSRLDLDDVATIGLSAAEFEKTRLHAGDLLIVEGNGSLDQIGRVALWNGAIPDCSHQNHLIRWRAGPRVLPSFVLYFLLSPEGRRQVVNVASSTTGLHTLSISKVSGLQIPLPNLPEQHEIVRRVETLFAFADRLEARCASAREQVGQLTPALLAKAFRGELVAQDPADEPAAELLKRLAASRAAAPAAKRGRKAAG